MDVKMIICLEEKIDLASDLFYKQKNAEGYQLLVGVIDGLMAITSDLKAAEQNECMLAFQRKFAERLQEITEAMLQKDTILIADMMKYDIMELLDELMEFENKQE